ncbi:MAG: ABC transporter ATP-binding protein/permease [Defluviitaleaceae bacterium]|nr:ABC transporter ATP-binding protein/permease [Defluviitaleaceae bacterium]
MSREKEYSILYLVWRVCVQYIKTSKWQGVLEQLVTIIHALSYTAIIAATRVLFDTITQASQGTMDFWEVATPLAILVALTIGQQIISAAESFISLELSAKNFCRYMEQFQRKIGRLQAEHFEDTDFLNDVFRAKNFIDEEELGDFMSLCFRIVTFFSVFFISVSVYLFSLTPILLLVIVAAFIPALLGQLAQIKIFDELEEENAPLRRQNEYYQEAIASRKNFKETRLLGGFRFFNRLFTETLYDLTQNTWKTERKVALLRTLLNIAAFAGFGVSIFMLFNATMAGDISVGAFAAVFAALTQIFSLMEEIVSSELSSGSEYIGQLNNYYKIMDMDEVGGKEGDADYSKGIIAYKISFTYPDREEKAVNKVSLTIKEGETIAIVGENGAGKSTLVRLLTGLYQPSGGTVKVGGLDTKKIHPNSVYKGISGVFQRYQRYKMSLKDNVYISDTKSEPNKEAIEQALFQAEFNEKTATLDTMLSPEFDGIDLSGGQWQRLAIARGLYRTSKFIVLDEPTAAIDPIEEERIFNQFKDLSKDKCAILVTHRLGSAKLADRIIVMSDGKISDIGTHDELVLRKGLYANMWKAQAAWYSR